MTKSVLCDHTDVTTYQEIKQTRAKTVENSAGEVCCHPPPCSFHSESHKVLSATITQRKLIN